MFMISEASDDKESPQFQLVPSDEYDARCGEVFITLKRDLVYICCTCDKTYGNFGIFLEHLSEHYGAIGEKDVASDIVQDESKPSMESITTIAMDDEYVMEEFLDTDEGNCEEFLDMTNSEENEAHSDYEELELLEEYDEESQNQDLQNLESSDKYGYDNTLPANESHSEITMLRDREKRKETCKKKSLYIEPKDLTDDNENVDLFKCDVCEKVFDSRKRLTVHKKIHAVERKHKCELCGLAFKTRTNLNAHRRRHTGSKTHACDMCSKKFYTATEMVIHKRFHTGETPYICDICGLSFQTSSMLSVHTKRHSGQAPFQCPYCYLAIYEKKRFVDHLLVHSDVRPFRCNICGATFKRQKTLKTHMEKSAHIKQRNYQDIDDDLFQ